MMMGLGQFVFSLGTLAYQEFERQTQWKHPSTARVGARPARQFTGAGDDSVTLQGVLVPSVAGQPQSVDDLRKMADSGEPQPLVAGSGKVYGHFVIESLSERSSHHFHDGTPRKTEFTLNLQRVDE